MAEVFTEMRLPLPGIGTRSEIVSIFRPLYGPTAFARTITRCGTIDLVLATLGMSGLSETLTIQELFVVSEDVPSSEIESPENRERIGFLASKVEKASLLDASQLAEHKELSDALSIHQSLVLLTDLDGETICIGSSLVGTKEEATLMVQYEIRWSFGDPTRFIARLNEALDALQIKNLHKSDDKLLHWMSKFEWTPPFLEEFKFSEVTTLLPNIHLHPHQKEGLENWEARNWVGIFKMCTGAGKTIASLAAIVRLSNEKKRLGESIPPVVVSVPTQILADQWCSIISGFKLGRPLQAYRSSSQWKPTLEPWLKSCQTEMPHFVVTTYKTLADPAFARALNRLGAKGYSGVWIADEMHNLSSPRLKAVMGEISRFFTFRLGLSATPEIEENDSATNFLLNYFGEEPRNPKYCALYELENGIKDGVLCHYRYYPVPAYLDTDVGNRYLAILKELGEERSNSPIAMSLHEERRTLLRKSGAQLKAFENTLPQIMEDGGISASLVYCPPGIGSFGNELSDEIDTDSQERSLLEAAVNILRKHKIRPCSIIGDTPQREREMNLKRFESGECDVICAIGCLDEGVDVPSIQTAIVLYSVDREKQFIQRRGRILRTQRDNKDKVARIYDVILLPHGSQVSAPENQELLEKELRRYREFAKLADNREEAQQRIRDALLATSAPDENNSEFIKI